VKSLAALRYAHDDPAEFDLESVALASSNPQVRTALLANAVRVSDAIFPELARALAHAIERIEPPIAIESFVTPNPDPNAQCIRLDDQRAAVVLTSGLVELLSTDEIPFVIGHEIGHHLFGHAGYPMPRPDIDDGERLRVLALRRAAEISADRMGFICSPSIDDVFRGMLKVAAGLSDAHIRLDLNVYLEQMRELESLAGHNDAIYDTHPMFPLRARALLWFSMSEGYYHWTGMSGQAPLDTLKLDAQVAEDFDAVSGFGLSHLESGALRSAKIWSLVTLATVDGRLTKREQSVLHAVLGAEEAGKAIRFVSSCGNDAPRAVAEKLRESLEAAAELPEKQRIELIEELERVASASGGTDEDRLRVLHAVSRDLGLDRDVQIRPWNFS
jgi:uncharacterized tellurite resistance protein B-like protein